MLWTQLKILLPTFFGYWVFIMVLASAAWWGWTKIYSQYTFKWAAPFLISAAACAYMIGNTVVSFYQNSRIYAYQQKMQASSAPAKSKDDTGGDPALQLKAKFLKMVEGLVSNPDQITPDTKNKLFSEYGPLFQKPSDKKDYEDAITSIYTCQRIFWEDAMASYKSKTNVKSDERKDCEKMSGAFFNRDKLIPTDAVKSNDETVASMAARKRVPASDGKMVEVSETMLRNILDAQIRASEAVKKIFE